MKGRKDGRKARRPERWKEERKDGRKADWMDERKGVKEGRMEG